MRYRICKPMDSQPLGKRRGWRVVDISTVIFNAIISNEISARLLASNFASLMEASEYALRENLTYSSQEALESALQDIKKLLSIHDGPESVE